MVEAVAATLGLLTAAITILTTFSKLQSVLSRLELRDLELREEIKRSQVQSENLTDRVELFVNGLKERIEHINTRLSGQNKEIASTVADIEAFLQKNTEYERRSRPY